MPSFLCFALCFSAVLTTVMGAYPPIWPKPAFFSNGTTSVGVDPNVKFTVFSSSDDIHDAITRYKALIFPHALSKRERMGLHQVVNIQVNVTHPDAALQLYVDESYTLLIPSDGTAFIQAATQFGVYHALETLSQLVSFDFDTNAYTIENAPWHIVDAPRFPHRQLMIDTARHYEPIPVLRQVIDAVTFAKVNTIHWHIVDQQSFPFNTPSRPLLASKGAYSSFEQYTYSDVAGIVNYARKRGVRVMVEFDTPGHAASWCSGYPEVCPSTSCPMPLRPDTNATFALLRDLLQDATGGSRSYGLFFENLIHLGGDEVDTTCWSQNPEISAWMQAQGLDAKGAYLYFVKRYQALAISMGREVVGWDEIWANFGTEVLLGL